MIKFPDPSLANAEGLLAVGANLQPETLLQAYANGIFPWYAAGQPIMWWSPDPRMVLFPVEFHCSRRLARRIRQGRYRISWDQAFEAVIRSCAGVSRRGEDGSWILPEMIDAYTQMHRLGHAHAVEVWQGDELVGGLYGVLLQGVFFAESMFSLKIDASKCAVASLCERALQQEWKLIDCQFYTDHLHSLGAREISRAEFLRLIRA